MPLPAGGAPVVAGEGVAALRLDAPEGAAKLEQIPATPYGPGVRLTTIKRLRQEDGISLVADVPNKISNDDTIHIRFWARTVRTEDESDAGRIRVNITMIVPQSEATAFFPPLQAAPKGEWELFDFPRVSRRPFAGNDARLTLDFGNTESQTIEIAGLQVLNYRQALKPSELPFQIETYEGRAPDAPWRKAAAARIEKHRKGDLTVRALDAKGKPISGAKVQVKMVRHAYSFGSQFTPHYILGTSPDAKKHQEWMPKLFNKAVAGNALKWSGWQNVKSREEAFRAMDWLRARGVDSRGHAIIWPAWRRSPASAKKLYDDTLAAQGAEAAKAVLAKYALDHVREITRATRGLVTDWDVVNEPKPGMDLLRILGDEAMADWFKAAREGAGPNVPLFLNHNAILSGGNMEPVLKYIAMLRKEGAPIDGVNEEGHTRAQSIPALLKNLDKLAATGLPIQITEFDIVTPDEQLQADWTRDYMTVMFASPATTGFLMWGFWDGAHWLGDAPIFYKDWTLKPSGKAYMDLVLRDWMTNTAGTTSAQGGYQTRGFLGDYEITVSKGDKSQVVKTQLAREGRVLTVTLK